MAVSLKKALDCKGHMNEFQRGMEIAMFALIDEARELSEDAHPNVYRIAYLVNEARAIGELSRKVIKRAPYGRDLAV